jgi:hypothetical protein
MNLKLNIQQTKDDKSCHNKEFTLNYIYFFYYTFFYVKFKYKLLVQKISVAVFAKVDSMSSTTKLNLGTYLV